MDKTISYINQYGRMIDAHIASIKDLLLDSNIQNIRLEYNEAMSHRHERQLNVFTMVSNLYYRENFHSDIIKVFLDPNEKHNEGTAFLFLFIDFLNNSFGGKITISKQHYQIVKAEREYGNIDILIYSEKSKHCIIIENKIHNAGDMPQQLPRYYDYMEERMYEIDAIVYLPLDPNKKPDQTTWTEQDEKNVLPLLCVIPAYKKNGVNLVDGWLLPCVQKTKNIDCISIIRQYSELIINLSDNIMDNLIIEKFYNSLLEGDNLATAISIKNMLNELPTYMKDRLFERFQNDGFSGVWSWKPQHCGILYKKDGYDYKIDIWVSERCYTITVFVQNTPFDEGKWSDEILKTLKDRHFCFKDKGWERYESSAYTIKDEEKVVCDVELLANQLNDMLK